MGIVDAVANRNPVSIAFQVLSDFMHYKDGVYTRWESGHHGIRYAAIKFKMEMQDGKELLSVLR